MSKVSEQILEHIVDSKVAEAAQELMVRAFKAGLEPDDLKQELKPIILRSVEKHFSKK